MRPGDRRIHPIDCPCCEPRRSLLRALLNGVLATIALPLVALGGIYVVLVLVARALP